MTRRTTRILALGLIIGGLSCVGVYAHMVTQAESSRSDAVAEFRATLLAQAGDQEPVAGTARTSESEATEPNTSVQTTEPEPKKRWIKPELQDEWVESSLDSDTSTWAPKRLEAWENLMEAPTMLPIALLEIPALDLEIPVYRGADDLQLDLGAGHINGTTPIGEIGNIGLSSHRDGFFRDLQFIENGHRIRLQDRFGDFYEYEVSETTIVMPEDLHVLEPQGDDRVTLVTCYPFYFVGHAPKRFIVSALRVDSPTDKG